MHIVFCAIKLLHKEKEPLKTCFDTELISTPGFIIPHLKMNWKAKILQTWTDKHCACRILFDKQFILYGEKCLRNQKNKATG